MTVPERVLIVRLSSIGDVVHALPGYMELRRAWPETRFGWAVEPAAHDLVAALDVDVHRVETPTFKRRPLAPSTWRELARLRRELRSRRYRLAVDFQGLLKSALVGRLAGAPLLGPAPADARESVAARLYRHAAPPMPEGLHAVERGRLLAQFATGTAPGALTFPELFDRATTLRLEQRLADHGLGEYVLLHSAANWDSKRYPDAAWVEVARRVHEASGLPVIWLWGPGEQERARELAAHAGPGQHASFDTTLPELAALIAGGRLLIGGDSAPLHLAVACRTPTVGVFGPTDPGILGPLDPADGVVRRVLPCSHCHRRVCPLGTRECLVELPPSSIVGAALARLEHDGAR